MRAPANTSTHEQWYNLQRCIGTNRETIETPMSALPSRFMQEMLPSPSTFYSEWGFGRANDSNMLPSPLNFQTPVVGNGQGWREEDRKRAAEDEAAGAEAKRSKS